MARRRPPGESSLELLLDTICNTFGGVLFLAMLVSLMLTQTRRKTEDSPADPAPAVSAADLVRLDTRAEDAARAVEALEAQASQARRADRDLAVPNAAEMLAAMEAAERRVAEAEARRTELLTALAREQAATARAAAAQAAADRDRERLAAEAERARRRLAAAVEERESLLTEAVRLRDATARRKTVDMTGNPPRMRDTEKPEFGLMLRYGRLYLMKILRGGRPVVNEADFTLTPGLSFNQARAKPHAGIDLSATEARDPALQRITAEFPPSRWYVCLVVHPDSFEEYATVKRWLTERGYECRLFPTDRSVTDNGDVSDVQVQ
jgi:multidrug efflux pump subunit AcrA (membrane-fusion protein)